MWGVGGGREGGMGAQKDLHCGLQKFSWYCLFSQQIIVQNFRRHRPALHCLQHWMGLLYQMYQLLYHVASLALAHYSNLAVSDDDGDY